MSQPQGIVKGDSLQEKISSVGAIVGATLIILGMIWVVAAGLGNPMEAQKKFSEQIVMLRAISLMGTLGPWALMIGGAGVYRSITARGAAWARLGFYVMIMGTTLWTVGMAIDIAVSAAIANWLAAPAAGKELAYLSVNALSPTLGLGRGMFPMSLMSLWLSYAFLGIGMVRSAIYPRWLGWAGLILGTIGVFIGMIMVFTGREVIFNAFIALQSLTIPWWLVIGIWMARKAWTVRLPI